MKDDEKKIREALSNYITAQVLKIFGAGFIAFSAISSIVQDYLGKEDYIKIISERWQNSYFTVPWALFLLLVVSFIITHARKRIDAIFESAKFSETSEGDSPD